MNYASVCSGVEAASMAWCKIGWNPVWFSEIEPFPCAVLKERFPHVPNLGDITQIKVKQGKNHEQTYTDGHGNTVAVPGGVDLLVGGTPCQGFSVAGKQKGLDDSRSALCLQYTRLLDEMRPNWFVWENVPGVFSTGGGGDFRAFLGTITDIGYCCSWRILDAQYCRVDGFPRAVPQRRRRVFVVGHIGDWEGPAKVLFEPESVFGAYPPRRVKGKGFTEDIIIGAGNPNAEYWNGRQYSETLKAKCNDDRLPDKGKLACVIEGVNVLPTLDASYPGHMNNQDAGKLIVDCYDVRAIDSRNELSPTLKATDCKESKVICVHGSQDPISNDDHANAVNTNNGLENCICQYGSVAGTLEARHDSSPCPDRGQNVVCIQQNQLGEIRTGQIAGTLNTNSNASGRNTPMVYDARGNGGGDVCPTITGDHANRITDYTPVSVQHVFAFDAMSSNSMKSPNPNSGCREIDCAKTLDTASISPAKNQGGMAVALAENTIGRKPQNGGNGIGTQEELAFTQNTTGVMGVCSGLLVRRLTPLECERLMGFPDNWTRIPWRGKPAAECPDGPRYKACGNSMAVNVMRWIGLRIQNYINENVIES